MIKKKISLNIPGSNYFYPEIPKKIAYPDNP